MVKKISLFFLILGVWVVSDGVNCKTPSSPAPSSVDCSTLIFNMADCLTFVTSGSNISKPEVGCCNGLKTVLKTNSECLCEAFKNSAQFGISVNMTKAITLPSACNVKAPPISNCDKSGAPSAAPGADLEAPGPSTTQVTPAAAPAGGSTNNPVPAPAPNDSGSSMTSISLVALLVSLVVASCSYF